MKPFNLAAALRGEPVCTVSGDPIYDLHKFSRIKRLVGVMNNGVTTWGMNGQWSDNGETVLDLRMAPKKHQLWSRAYRDTSGKILCWTWTTTKDQIWSDIKMPWVSDPVLVYEWEE